MLAGKDITMMDGLMISITGILMVFLELLLLSIIITLISKAVTSITKKKTATNTRSEMPEPEPNGTPLPETESAGTINLENVSEEEAAMIMAIVSNQSGIPLNKLSFKSIKLVEEKK